MKKYLSKGLGFLVLSSLLLGATPALAIPSWDVSGITGININYLATDYLHNVTFSEDTNTGVVTGSGTSGAYAWTVTSGLVNGNNFTLTANYTATPDAVTPQTTMTLTGTISAGLISGTWNDNYNGGSRSGTFTTASGTASAVLLPQTITFGSLSDMTYGDADFTVSATGGASGNPVTFTSQTGTVCTVTGNLVSMLTVGTCTVRASQAGDMTYSAAPDVDQSFAINPKTLTVTGGSVTSKVYDDTNTATVVFTAPALVGVLPADVANVTLDTSLATGTYNNENVGTGKAVTVAGVTISGSQSGNYTVTQPALTGDITARPITVTAVTDTKVYNGNANSSGIPTLTAGTLAGGDTLNFTQSYNNKNVGTGKTLTPAGTVNDGNGGLNYNVTPVNDTTGVITAKVLNVVPSAANKVYDANTAATISFTDDRVSGDVLTVSGTGSFATKVVDTGKVVSLLTAVKSGTDAGNYSLVVTPTVMLADITAAPLVPVVTASNKVYDGNTTASATCTVPALGTDVVTCSVGAATWDTKDVGNGKTVTATGITIGGADAGNYTVATTATDTANITPKVLSVSFTADNKVYDSTNSATILTRTLTGVVVPDVVTATGGTAVFAAPFAKFAANGKTVTATGFTLTGADAGNYSVGTISSTTANITKRPLTVTANAGSANRVYNGGTSATVTLSDDRVSGDSFTLNRTAAFTDKHAANGKTVNVTGISLPNVFVSPDASNYTLSNTTTTTTANITPKPITLTAVTSTKVYDTTTSSPNTPTLPGGSLVGGDTGVRSQTYNSASVGTGKTLTPVIVITDGHPVLAGNNYNVIPVNNTTGVITAAPVTVAFTADNKVYDGNNSATILTRTVTGNIAPDPVITATGGTAVFNNKNVGTGKTVTASGFTLDNPNYAVTVVTPTTANITAKPLVVTANASDKVYDATTGATVTFGDNRVAGDVFTVSGVANFSDKNVGNNKTVNVTGITLTGTDAGNYAQNTTTTDTADIDPVALLVSASAQNKQFDGTTTATVTLANDAFLGDVVTQTYATADFDTAAVGVGKTVTVNGITTSGADAGNYTANTSAITTADITEQPSSGGGSGSRVRPRTVTGTTGTVLGAEKFTFTLLMKQGSVGNEVMELQKFLNANGFGPLVVDGKFGPMTRAAVVKFQLANGLKGDGVVGPLTRAVLNK